jgi:hypothetical protein
VRIFRYNEKPEIAQILDEQKLPKRLVGTTVKISQVGEYGIGFYSYVSAASSSENEWEWHVYFTRAPRIFKMDTAAMPASV